MTTLVSTLAALALAATGAVITVTAAQAAAPSYSSCDALLRDFSRGVARSDAAANRQVREGNRRPASGPRAQRVYRANNSSLDRDNDGTACEISA
jgi:hypothetical protein